MKRLKWDSLLVSLWREYETVIVAIGAIGVVIAIAAALIRIMPTFEGLTNEEAGLNKNDVASPDPDLKCTGPGQEGSAPATCAPADIIRLVYDISLDPRLSILETKNILDVYNSRGDAAAAAIAPFTKDILMLRAATMYNTDSNEAVIQDMLDNMKKTTNSPCYTNDFMATAKGFLVGTKDQKTLTVAQSEAVRCYAHRFNGIRKCLNACNNTI